MPPTATLTVTSPCRWLAGVPSRRTKLGVAESPVIEHAVTEATVTDGDVACRVTPTYVPAAVTTLVTEPAASRVRGG